MAVPLPLRFPALRLPTRPWRAEVPASLTRERGQSVNSVEIRMLAWEREQRTNQHGLRWASRLILARLKRALPRSPSTRSVSK